jgi:hypothetical protein
MHCLQKLFFSLLSPLTEPVGVGVARLFGFTCSQWFCERRSEEKEKELL